MKSNIDSQHTSGLRRWGAALALALALAGLAPPLSASAKGVTSFRGISLGMTPEQFSGALPPEFYLGVNNVTVIRREDNNICGEVTALQITLFRCYFGADDYSFETFAQAIADSYNIRSMELVYETIGRSYTPLMADAQVMAYLGQTIAGDVVRVVQVLSADRAVNGGEDVFLRVSPARAATPTFN
ncbi:MAG: hypothetical protein ACWA6X_00865 [Bauldia sp.]